MLHRLLHPNQLEDCPAPLRLRRQLCLGALSAGVGGVSACGGKTEVVQDKTFQSVLTLHSSQSAHKLLLATAEDGSQGYYNGTGLSASSWFYELKTASLLGKPIARVVALGVTQMVMAAASTAAQRLAQSQVEFGAQAQLADFKDMADAAPVVTTARLIEALELKRAVLPELPAAERGVFVRRDGATSFNGVLQYFMAAHEGTTPAGFTAYETIDSGMINLGASVTDRQVSVKVDVTSAVV